MKPVHCIYVLVFLATCLALGELRPTAGATEAAAAPAAFAPTFSITPLVHEHTARPGQKVPFTFHLKAKGKAKSVRIASVGMRQQETGQIYPAAEATPKGLVLDSPTELVVLPDGEATISGHIIVPPDASFVTYGLLVTDLSATAEQPSANEGAGQAALQVRFVTRYLLRIEVQVLGGQRADVSKLWTDAAGVIDRDGRAIAQITIENPTQSALRPEVTCRVLDANQRLVVRPFALGLPVRSKEESARRFEIPLLAMSRVRLEAAVPEPLFPGTYQVEFTIVGDGQRRQVFHTLEVSPDDFPAQATVAARVSSAVQIAPSQIELSPLQGGVRIATLSVANHGDTPVDVVIEPVPHADIAADWLVTSPRAFVLRPGANRNVLVTFRSEADRVQNLYGHIQAQITPAQGAPGTLRIPTALRLQDDAQPTLQLQDVVWDPQAHAFLVKITNPSAVHASLNAQLQLMDPLGRTSDLLAGFGQWLLPGDSTELRFPLGRGLPDGDYHTNLRLSAGGSAPPLRRAQTVQISRIRATAASADTAD